MKVKPVILMNTTRPPFLVPPEEFDLWVNEDNRAYKSWKSRSCDKTLTKEDFRNHIIDINNEFNMEDVFDKLEIGLEAFEKLVAFCRKVPKYSLAGDLEEMYKGEANLIVKDFIIWGKKIVQEYQSVDEMRELEKGEVEAELLEMSKSVDEDLKQNSGKSECPDLSAEFVLPPTSPYLSPGWGTLLPSSVHQELSFQPTKVQLWRPWESGVMVQDKKSENNGLEGRTEAGTDLYRNSSECPLLPAAGLLPLSLQTPLKPAFSPFYPSTPRRKLLRKGTKKKRSSGDLAKRRQRLITFQLSHTPPSTPLKLEPDQSTLESSNWGGCLGSWGLDSKPVTSRMDLGNSLGTPLGHGRCVEEDSNQLNPNLLYPPSPQSWCTSPGWVSTPLPAPCPPQAWMSSNMAPPSPAFCAGCQRWGNLLSVTVSQTRAM